MTRKETDVSAGANEAIVDKARTRGTEVVSVSSDQAGFDHRSEGPSKARRLGRRRCNNVKYLMRGRNNHRLDWWKYLG